MKKTLIIASLVVLGAVASQAQGLVSLSLTSGSLVSTNSSANVTGKIQGTGANGYYFELLISSSLAQTATPVTAASTSIGGWSDSTVTAASFSSLNAGKLSAASPATASGWTAPDATYDNQFAVEVIGWSASYGTTYSAFLTSLQAGLAPGGYFGYEVGLNVAGGGSVPLNSVNLWGNQTGGTGDGFNSPLVLQQVVTVPEPTTMALAGLGGLGLLALRRKK